MRALAIATRCFWPPDRFLVGLSANSVMFTAASTSATLLRTSSSLRSYLPRPKATSARTVGMMTWWSGFWKTKAAGWLTLATPPLDSSRPPSVRSRVDFPQPLGPSSM
mmetsp:Transcript_23448/g.65042  ORF Transcript_23448/g.65042 Transcript_23448/m.65042 type:complete len:108 (+) Transcript_23448:195-518(+)